MKNIYIKKGFVFNSIITRFQSFLTSMIFKNIAQKETKSETTPCRTTKTNYAFSSGFTLVEMIVALGLFTVVLAASSSAFLNVINIDRKSRSMRVAMDNVNLALEDMSRRIKTGTSYDCGGGDIGTNNCDPLGSPTLSFDGQDGKRVTYKLSGTTIQRTIGIGGTTLNVTAPDITINTLMFVVGGSTRGDTAQPYVGILINGTVQAGGISSTINVQTMATQRDYDF